MADTSGLRAAIAARVVEIASAALAATYAETVQAAPERTGALRQLIDTTGPDVSGEFTVSSSISCSAPYAQWTDQGSDPHPIVGNPFLAFFWDRIGKFVVLRSVNHPGTQGTHWFDGGQDGGEPMRSRWAAACAGAA